MESLGTCTLFLCEKREYAKIYSLHLKALSPNCKLHASPFQRIESLQNFFFIEICCEVGHSLKSLVAEALTLRSWSAIRKVICSETRQGGEEAVVSVNRV